MMASRLTSRALRHASHASRSFRINTTLWFPTTRICAYSASAPRRTTVTQHLPSSPTIVTSLPSPDYLEQEEIDVELLPAEEAKVIITDRAAEVTVTSCTEPAKADSSTLAITENIGAGERSQCCITNSRRVWWMSRLSVQDGIGQESVSRRLVSRLDLTIRMHLTV